MIWNRVGQIWNGSSFEAYASGNYATLYAVSLVEQSTSGIYLGTFPAAIPAGVYDIIGRSQLGGSPAQSDPTIGTEDYNWSGSATLPLSDLVTSGQLGQISPIRVGRGTMVQNFPIYLKSSLDHVSPLVSGVPSGQIARDSGSFGPLQSGAFTEKGLGFYTVNLTSGDLLGNSISLLFTANGVSGGSSDPLPLVLLTQRTSGQ